MAKAKKKAQGARAASARKASRKTNLSAGARGKGTLALLLGTAKGGFLLEADAKRARWSLKEPFKLGARTHDLRLDPRDGRTLLMCSTGGHLGPTIYRSSDRGKSWDEAKLPPRFGQVTPKTPRAKRARASRGFSVRMNFWLQPGPADEPGVWYCGTCPQGLFRSEDGGNTWSGVDGLNLHAMWTTWFQAGKDQTPDGPVLHSIQIDPRDARHMTVSASSGGTFETWNRGKDWKPINRGLESDFLPSNDLDYGQDPHCMVMHPGDPDRWYQQNHCGIYHLDRATQEAWTRIGRKMPKAVGDIGFPMVPHPTDPDTVWVFPMDGTTIWPRTSPAGAPAAYVTRDGGKSWKRQDHGLPKTHAYWTVLRQAMAADDHAERTGVYFGTTSGEVWGSVDGGASWKGLAAHLPRIFSLRVARFRR